MDIVEQTTQFVTTKIFPYVSPKQLTLFSFGLKAITFTPYKSLGSNAREIVENIHTASSKIYRLVSNKKIIKNFYRILAASGLVVKDSLVNVDFSTFCGFQALVFAVQTKLGRALPVWNNSITYPITNEGSQNIFVLDEIQKFGEILGFFPRFVFDRGFWIPCVMKFLLEHKIMFYLRIKQGQHLEWEPSRSGKTRKRKHKGKKRKKHTAFVIGSYTKDAIILLHGCRLRLIISPPPPKQGNQKKKQNTQRWYILTNDTISSREEIIAIYRFRFEIEETFKDIKHIGQLKTFHITQVQTFRILLWFASLALWLSYWREMHTKQKQQQKKDKKERSFFRIFWEELQREIRIERLNQIVGIVSPG